MDRSPDGWFRRFYAEAFHHERIQVQADLPHNAAFLIERITRRLWRHNSAMAETAKAWREWANAPRDQYSTAVSGGGRKG